MAFMATLFLGYAPYAQANEGWVREGAVRMRILPGGGDGDGLKAGLEIALDSGWKTYWVSPGPLGLAPRLDWSGSTNLDNVDVLWPAPQRFSDGDAQSAGYVGQVILPLKIRAEDPVKPVDLALKIDAGICSTQCVPIQVRLSLSLMPGQGADALALARLDGFRGRVPAPSTLGSTDPFAIISAIRVAPETDEVTVRAPTDTSNVDLFVERGDEVLVGLPVPMGAGDDGTHVFRLKLRRNAPAAEVRLVAVAGGKAIAVPLALDGNPATP
jgi:DsbC/DsbD-like thiol-disulfide interchange protein